MDEETFTTTEKVIIYYDYFDEVTRWAWANRDLARAEEELAKANKVNPKTETGMARKEKAVAKWTAEVEKINAKMDGWKREG
jgi:predicted  nucleic acid-binding Zn-ribbon protein